MQATEVMTLGRLGLSPQWRTNPMTTPAGRGPLRQTVNGLGRRSGSLARMLMPMPPAPPRPPGFGRVFIETPAIGPALVETPALMPGAAAARFVTPGIGPAAFQTPSLLPGQFRLGRSLLGGLSRARRVALGQVEVTDEVLSMTGEALDAAFTDAELTDIAQERAQREGSADVYASPGQPAVQIGRGTVIGWGIVSTVSSVASLYHGYRRNNSLAWGLWWGLMGAMFPILTPAVAVAQNFGKPKRR